MFKNVKAFSGFAVDDLEKKIDMVLTGGTPISSDRWRPCAPPQHRQDLGDDVLAVRELTEDADLHVVNEQPQAPGSQTSSRVRGLTRP